MNIVQELQRLYFILLAPSLSMNILFCLLATHITIPDNIMEGISYGTAGTALLVLSSVFCLALPLFYRSYFAGSVRNRTSITVKEFAHFQKKLLCICMTAPYLSAMAILMRFTGLFLYGPVLLALYAAYFYFPWTKKVSHDKKIFRVRDD